MSGYVQEVATFLDNHWARNQILKIAQYATAMVSGLLENTSSGAAGKLLAVSSKISGVRVVLRLLDDIPTLAYNLSSRKRGGSLSEQIADALQSAANQLYYPAEHVAWAADQGLLPVQSSRFWLLSNILWATSLVIGLLQTLVALYRLTGQLNANRKVIFEDDITSCRAAATKLHSQLAQALLSTIQITSDLALAVHWMPAGFPGAGSLSNAWLGFFGLTSSLIGLHKMLLPSKH